ncbi:MAG TPA: hypothetical protein DCP69_04085 [Candidatus Omnitrophica bacterium]|nr:hypothetical protein [Candidatus Omnitrophota bacterium]
MKLTNCYCTLAELKARLTVSDTIDDAALKSVMESVSRLIDTYCGRRFYVETRTRYFTPTSADMLDVDSLLSVTTLGTDDDGDRTYENTWAATDYDLMPLNAPYESPPRPYTYITVTPNGTYSFPNLVKSVSILGSWGFYSVMAALDTLGAAITSTTATTFTATAGSLYSPGHTLLIGSEQMHVQSVNGNTITVTRGANGTTAATALISAAVSVYTYPMVTEAALLQCARIFARRNAPFGITGNAEMGTLMALPKLDQDVGMMLNPVKSYAGF